MKVLIISDEFPPQVLGGAGTTAFNLARKLKELGNEIFVMTTCRDKKDEENFQYQNLNIFRIHSDYKARWRNYLSLYNPQTVGKVRRLIQEIKPDIIHAQNIHYWLSYHCLKIAKQYSRAVFLTANDTMLYSCGKTTISGKITWWDLLKQAKKRYNPFRNIMIRYYLRYVDKIFAVSQELETALRANKINNVALVYNGIAISDWTIEPPKIEEFKKRYNLGERPVIFLGGRLSYLKGAEQAIRFLAEIKKEIPEVVLLVVGSDGFFEKGEKLVEKLGVKENIVFTGWLAGDNLKAAYHSADIVILPDIYFDALPIILVEAMACKKPVVGSCFACTSETTVDGITGYVVNPLEINQTSEKILDLLKNQEKAKQFGLAGLERVKTHFSLDSQVSQTLSLYQKYLKIN